MIPVLHLNKSPVVENIFIVKFSVKLIMLVK